MAKNKLTWKEVPVGETDLSEGNADAYSHLYPRKRNVTINPASPQEGLFPPGFDDYMQYWPEEIEKPVSIVVLQNEWTFFVPYRYYDGYPEAEIESCPTTVLTMPNGAIFTLQEIDPAEQNECEEIFEGDWSVYAEKGSVEMNTIIDIVYEAYESAGNG